MALTIQDCANSIVTRLLTMNYGGSAEQTGDRLAIKATVDSGEIDLGGHNRDSAEDAVIHELRAWLQGMDDDKS